VRELEKGNVEERSTWKVYQLFQRVKLIKCGRLVSESGLPGQLGTSVHCIHSLLVIIGINDNDDYDIISYKFNLKN
jgi:hypothetical protein